MAQFGSSYVPPGVYTDVVIDGGGQPLFGNQRIPVIIGEGQEFFSTNNQELFRGSSSIADDQAVDENISDQIGEGLSRTFTATYFPVTDGSGKGVVTNDPTKIQVLVDNIPATVLSLNGLTGSFTLQDIVPTGSNLEITYYFKRGDLLITNESLSYQIPAFATLTIPGASSSHIALTTTLPGAGGNNVSIELQANTPAVDQTAVSGYGTDSIIINITKADSTVRTVVDLKNLIDAGIQTASAGYLVAATPTGTGALSPAFPASFTGGSGPNSNTLFKVKTVPIVDGTNGGVVTTTPSDVTVYVNSSPVTVTALDGANGLVTLANPVAYGSSLTITYYTNTYQNTSDLLPASNVSSITQIGFGPDRSDFVQDVDYVLGKDANGNPVINWGASSSTASGVSTSGSTPFGATQINTTLVDEHMYLRPVKLGSVDGKNTVFTLYDSPTDGSGLSNATDDPTKIQVYVGTNPMEALKAGTVAVSRLSGAAGIVTLYNPPTAGLNVYASYYRNTLNDHSYTVKVVTPGQTGTGTYTIADENGFALPVVENSTTALGSDAATQHVAATGAFATTGIVWPNAFPDAWVASNAIAETVTLTFNADGTNVTPGVQASATVGGVTFTATTPAANTTTSIAFIGATPNIADSSAVQTSVSPASWAAQTTYTLGQIINDGTSLQVVTTAGTSGASAPTWTTATGTVTDGGVTWTYLSAAPAVNHIFVYLTNLTAGTRTKGQVAALFAGGAISTLLTGAIMAATVTPTTTATTGTVTFSGGSDPSSGAPYCYSYTVASSEGSLGSHGTGYLDQTYVDQSTGLKLTIVNPQDAESFGYTTLPSPSYYYAPGDTLVFTVSPLAARYTGTTYVPFGTAQPNNSIAIPGLATTVANTLGANAADTAIVNTYNKSGNSPTVGDFYYVSFTTNKTSTDMGIQIYNDPKAAFAVYGQPNTTNRVSLGINFLTQNGAQTFGVIQVPKQTGLNVASDASFISAIQSLTINLPGTTQKANVIVPLSTSTTVHQFLSRQLITQATARYKGEGIGFVGYSQYTTPVQAISNATSLKNSRMIAIGNPVAGVQITDSQTGVAVEYAVSGEFLAAALAGLNTNPANDVATSLTLQDIVGFTRLLVRYDDATMNQMAQQGLVLLTDNNGALNVRHYKSTDPSNPITSEPTSTTVTDYTAQLFRADLNQFIGRKLVDSLVTDITTVCNARLRSLVSNEILTGYKGLSVTPDASDPTVVTVTVSIKPMFSLLYVSITFTVTTTL